MGTRTKILEREGGASSMDFPPQRWATVAAWIAAGANIPAALWRILMLLGVIPHHQSGLYHSSPGWLAYVLGLDLLQVGAGLLTLGLVQPWGERWWAWLPGIGGRRIPALLVEVVAGLGCLAAAVIVYVTTAQMIWRTQHGLPTPMSGETGWRFWLWLVMYLPALLWPLCLAITLVGFVLRRRGRDQGLPGGFSRWA